VIVTPSPTATRPARLAVVRFSEVLPAPLAVDWDGDGAAGARDEYIEIINASQRPMNVGGWTVDLGRASAASYRIPRGTSLRAGAYLLLPARRTGLALPDTGGTLRLLDQRGQLVEAITYGALPPDTSLSRDMAGAWHPDYPPSPGMANLPAGAAPALRSAPLSLTPTATRRP
jgi:hypothetical protein